MTLELQPSRQSRTQATESGTSTAGGGTAARAAPLVAKLSAPSTTGHEIERTQICERILASDAARLVLLRAPAGFGKTTVMLEVRRELIRRGVQTAWLTLDRADNDVGRFLTVLAAAMEPLIPGLASSGFASGPAPDDIAFALIDQVAALHLPFALFLDDFEALQNPAVLGLVKELIEQLPAGARLIVGSRGVPELGLGRLRGAGRLLEVEPAHLRFSVEETDHFLRERRNLKLEPNDVVRLHRSTEGWAAALWLASISLENRDEPGRFIAGFTGSNAAVVDYLVDDVLARQSDDIRGFLLRTSIVTDLNASLCNVLCNRTDSFEVLGTLERAHLFLVPIQADRSRYRYHSMFAEFLRTQLKRNFPDEVPALHLAASRWYLSEGRPVPAIEHALAAQDLDFALPMLRRQAQTLLDQGRVRLLSRWLDPLLEQGLLDADPMLQVVHAWAVLLSRGPHDAAPLLDRLERLADPDPEVRAHRMSMRPLFLVLGDRTDEAMPLAAELLAGVPENVAFVQGFLEVVLANLAMIAGQYHEALRFADAARSRQPGHLSSFNLALSEAAEGAVDLTQGRLRKAIAHLRLAVSTGTDASRATNGNAMAGVLLAEALYEADLCDQAERLLTVYIPLIRAVGIPDQLIIAHTVMARIALNRGDADQAQQLLAELQHIGHREGLARVVASARLERARMLAVDERLAQARTELDRSGDKAMWSRIGKLSLRANEVETHDLGVARWSVRSGHASEVIPGLKAELDAAERAQRERRALTLRLVLAQAYHRSGQGNKAMRLLAKATRFAATEGYVRALLDEGPLLIGMLHQLREVPDLLVEEPGSTNLTVFVDRLLGLKAHAPEPDSSSVPAKARAGQPEGTDESLTRKEIHVLRLASEGLSNVEIAERLFVAETTVRTHLRNINVKLGVRNRMEAIVVARKAGLLA